MRSSFKISRSTDSLSRNKSLCEIKSIFATHGYPKKFINSVMQQTLHTQSQRQNELPFINEELKRRALSIVRRTGLENIRLHFDNGPSLFKIFAPRKEKLSCPDNCDTCKLATKTNLCKIKTTIYLINCLHCHLVYVRETRRTIRSRDLEFFGQNYE